MATNKTRITALESKPQKLPHDYQVALDYWGANRCELDILPREDMTKGECAALADIATRMKAVAPPPMTHKQLIEEAKKRGLPTSIFQR
jgi:hypothetical protein